MVQLLVMSIKFTHRYSSTGAARINPGHGTKIARGFVRYKGEKGSFNSSHLYLYLVSPLVPQEMSQHQNCKRRRWYNYFQLLFIRFTYEFLSLRLQRGVPLSVYMNFRCV